MEQIYKNKLSLLGYTQLVCDIFPKWEDVKDEILVPERKSGTGNGTIHVFLGAADNDLRKEFASYYRAVNNGEDPSVGAIEVKHYFLTSNVLSMIGYVCQYYYSKGQNSNDQVKAILSLLSSYPSENGLLETTSFFKLSTGSSRLRPYFKQFDSNGVFSKLIRQLLLPNSGYKISLYKNANGKYAAFWLIGFDWQTDFEANSNKTLFSNKQLNEDYPKKHQQISYGAPETEYIRSYLTALRTKPFMLLAGISGTGKSRIVRKLAQATTTQKYDKDEDRWKDNRPENFELIQVKPNWHNSMDVVGFYSNISGKYEFTPFVEFIVKTWQHQDTPYFLCLDEMNLAPVEEYFAEFLSAIESRSTDENGEYITDPIIKPFKNFGEKEGKSMLIQLLGDADPIDKNPLAIHFYEKGLTLPPNLMVMGTVNMDETTFSFSRKVLDRAMSVEMNEVDYDKFLSGESEQFPLLTDMNELLVNRPERAAEVTEEIESDKVIAYLKDVNTLMEGTPFKLGYRAANEAMLYVAACKKFARSDYALANALDEFTLMKILSRIEGDDSRLGIADDDPRIATLGIEASEQHTSLLTCLKAIVHKHIGASSETEKKIDQMCNTLEREHFVSYWA